MESMLCFLYVLLNVCNLLFAQNDNCRVGTYGNNCQLKCPDQCRPLQIFPCNKKTGRCAEGCNNGYHGDKCDKNCSCPSGICYQANGDCTGTDTTTDQNTQSTTNRVETTKVQTNDDEGVIAGWRSSAITLIVFIICLVLGGIALMFYLRFKKQEITLTGSCKIRFSNGADAHVSGDEENGLEQGKTPLMKEEAGVVATGGQNESSKQHGDQPEETQQRFKEPAQVEELKQQIKHLQEEKRQSDAENEKMKGDLSRYEYWQQTFKEPTQVEELKQQIKHLQQEKRRSDAQFERYQYRENVIQGLLVPISKSTKSSMSTNHLMSNKGLNKDNWLHCPHLMFDKETVNVKVAKIDDNMVLRNIPDQNNPGNNSRRLQQFQGVICNEPLVKTGLYQYFEALFDIALPQPVGEGIIAQFGFCGEKDKEPITPFIDKPCFLVEVASSKKQDKICMMFIYKGKTVHMQEVMNNLGGSSHRVHIGICLKKDMKRIRIFDCGEVKYVSGTDIDIGEKIWPMFGVCAKNEASVSVQLIAGCDITMWKEKKEMLKTKHTKK